MKSTLTNGLLTAELDADTMQYNVTEKDKQVAIVDMDGVSFTSNHFTDGGIRSFMELYYKCQEEIAKF